MNQQKTTDWFIKDATKVHSNRYIYSNVEYINNYTKVIIGCRMHGNFKQAPNDHLKGQGCPICGKLSSIRKRRRTTGGWTLKDWKRKANESKFFESFKVYIIKCWDNSEEFFKIGRTFTSLGYRFSSKNTLPYEYDILKIYEGTAEDMYKLEKSLQKENKSNFYTPNKRFKGRNECFSSLEKY